MRYSFSQNWTDRVRSLAVELGFKHISIDRLACIRSEGTKTRRTIARIHTLGKAMQAGMRSKPYYVIELISERFDKQNETDQIKTLIHELMHIPHSFSGGFRHHKPYVTERKVEEAYQTYINRKN